MQLDFDLEKGINTVRSVGVMGIYIFRALRLDEVKGGQCG